MGAVQVLFFGPAQDAAGIASIAFPLTPGATLAQLIDTLLAAYPPLARARLSLRFAVNGEFAEPNRLLQSGDEVAVIPPVSGGADDVELIELTGEPIDAGRLRRFVSNAESLGGIVTFEGATRDERHPEHGGLIRLEYQAYGEMAMSQMRKLAATARARWPIGKLALAHRTGLVQPGETSVMIAVACPHRAEAFESCRWLIDALKKEVPIWKREVWADGQSTWVDPIEETPLAAAGDHETNS